MRSAVLEKPTLGISNGSLNSPRSPVISSAVLGMTLFVLTELMFFVALLSSYTVIKASKSIWVPPVQVRLPFEVTFLSGAFLLLSAALLMRAGRKLSLSQLTGSRPLLGWTILFGALFLVLQSFEWINLMKYGMTLSSGIFSACFFLIVGAHAFHVLGGLLALAHFFWHWNSETGAPRSYFRALQLFWYFVVAIWPVLYSIVHFQV